MYNKIELLHETLSNRRTELRECIQYSEMSDFQRDFLCGMIQYKRPGKIVEIGVSAGATTAVVLSCLEELNIPCEMYSVDLSERWCKDRNRETGFVVKDYMEIGQDIRHRFMLGKPIPYIIDDIGGDIDFLILDSSHSLPGEVLDFLTCMPYLAEKAVVVLHDIILDLSGVGYEVATKGLFCAVKAKKWYMEETGLDFCGLSNIAAFEVSGETRDNIEDAFMCLSMKWNYLLPEDDWKEYNQIIAKHYSSEIVDWMQTIEKVQKLSHKDTTIESHMRRGGEWLEKIWKRHKNVILYGAGYWGREYLAYARLHHLPVSCFVVSDGEEKISGQIEEIPVYFLSELPMEPNSGLIIRAVDKGKWDIVTENLIRAGWHTVI